MKGTARHAGAPTHPHLSGTERRKGSQYAILLHHHPQKNGNYFLPKPPLISSTISMPLGTIVHDVLDRQINTLLLRLRGLAKIACFSLVEELVPFLDHVPSPSRPRLEGQSSLAVVSSNFGGAE